MIRLFFSFPRCPHERGDSSIKDANTFLFVSPSTISRKPRKRLNIILQLSCRCFRCHAWKKIILNLSLLWITERKLTSGTSVWSINFVGDWLKGCDERRMLIGWFVDWSLNSSGSSVNGGWWLANNAWNRDTTYIRNLFLHF